MPTDSNETSISLPSMTTANENFNHGSSSLTTTSSSSSSTTTTTTAINHTQSPPLSSSLQTQTSTANTTTTNTRSSSPTQIPSKHLEKLRCFLSTLYYFGSDISNEIGDRVRALILALVVSVEKQINML